MPFLRVLKLCEIQTPSFKIWIQEVDSSSDDDDDSSDHDDSSDDYCHSMSNLLSYLPFQKGLVLQGAFSLYPTLQGGRTQINLEGQFLDGDGTWISFAHTQAGVYKNSPSSISNPSNWGCLRSQALPLLENGGKCCLEEWPSDNGPIMLEFWGNVEYPFIAITSRSTQAQSGSTW